jgi:hypothetical protein
MPSQEEFNRWFFVYLSSYDYLIYTDSVGNEVNNSSNYVTAITNDGNKLFRIGVNHGKFEFDFNGDYLLPHLNVKFNIPNDELRLCIRPLIDGLNRDIFYKLLSSL